MPKQDDERPFRLRPHRPAKGQDEAKVWAGAFQRLVHLVRMSKTGSSPIRGGSGSKLGKGYRQRCAVRVSYTRNQTRGQWAAHGRYVMREAAVTHEGDCGMAFDGSGEVQGMAQRLAEWQAAGDQRLFKLIISPEFGDRVDLPKLTRDLMQRIEGDIGRRLEWIAVAHWNTEHPHVHVALRGVADGAPLRFRREYIQAGMRQHAEELCTLQLGYRSQLDAEEAERREVRLLRYTSLDRLISGARTDDGAEWFAVDARRFGAGKARPHLITARLLALEEMGISHQGQGGWQVRTDFEGMLRAMQRANDRQKALAASAFLLSDERLRLHVTETRNVTALAGRVLSHGLDEQSGRAYMLMEGTDAKVHYVLHTQEIEEARHKGQLRPGSFVTLEQEPISGRLNVHDFGDADQYLTQYAAHLRNTAQQLQHRGALASETSWGGWLGRYHSALQACGTELREMKARSLPTYVPSRSTSPQR